MGMSHAELCVVTAEKRCRRLQKMMFIQCSLKNAFFPVVALLGALGLRNLNILHGFFTNMHWWLQINPGSGGFLQLAALSRSWTSALPRERPQGDCSCCASTAMPMEMKEKSNLWLFTEHLRTWDVAKYGCKWASCVPVSRALLPLCCSFLKQVT